MTLVDAEGLLTSEAADDDLDVDELEDDELDEIDDELGGTAVEVGLEIDELNVCTGDGVVVVVVVGVYTVENLDTADVVAAVAHLGCQKAFPHPTQALATALYGFEPFCTAAAAVGSP